VPTEHSERALARVCDIPVDCCSHEQVLRELDRNIAGPRAPLYISITNTESMYHARRIPAHKEYIEGAAFSLCDGMGVVIGGLLNGQRIPRFNGPALVLEACAYGVPHGWRHYFCGGREGVADKLAERLCERFPGLIVAGTWCPPFRGQTADEEQAMLRAITDARPDVLWVGLGLLKQEAWISRYRTALSIPWMAGVGAAFDFHAGTARWAPAWVRRIGFEWLYRLFFEPRMLKRNYWSLLFVIEAAIAGITGKAPLIGKKG
jgi:N-acetylglucosaminyldiphosphoundecaprenol N-acetyl-beta-D-mannosaminyltransferase